MGPAKDYQSDPWMASEKAKANHWDGNVLMAIETQTELHSASHLVQMKGSHLDALKVFQMAHHLEVMKADNSALHSEMQMDQN